ncbi:MAG: phosphomannomutase/phosphoglucomutase [Proteobacteria bacterium]|nr:phosphomannomutase/phosphoglucomutase [Pseudomonadota bacterium]
MQIKVEQINPEVFREYDIRGTVDKDLSPQFAYLLGRSYATLAKEHGKTCISIGHDCRLSSPAYAKALGQGLSDEGIDVVHVGEGPTPQLYYSVFSKKLGGGIQVTGSHNPPEMNGFKILLGEKTLSGAAIQDLKARALVLVGKPPSSPGKGTIRTEAIRERYIDELIANSRPFMGPRKLKVVVDAGNGVGGLVGPAVLRGLGCEVIELYCEPDGRFPNHHPDPTVMKNIETLIAKVKETKADFGIGWDGDADRIGAVNERGEVIFGDMLLLLYGRELLKHKKNPVVIGDVKCSSLLFDDLSKRGANAIMWKTGHSLIKAKLAETHGDLAGEMSGHMFFKHRFYGFDDALYASARLCEIVSNAQGPVSALLADLPKRVSTPEIRFNCPESIKFKVPELAKEQFKGFKTDLTDGIRIQFDAGWGLVRASNTQPVLVMRFEADTVAQLEEYQQLVTSKIEGIIRGLGFTPAGVSEH